MAANEIGSGHQVGGPNGIRPEAQVRLGLRTRLLRVVDEVRLRVQTFFGPEDLDRVLVRADRSVRTQPEEDRPDRIGRLDVERRVVVDAGPGDVVVDADGEPPPRLLAGEFGEHAGNHGGGELLGGQPVTSAGDARHDRPLSVGVRLGERRDDVQIQRLADRTGLLGAVQHADRAHRRRQRVEERSWWETAGTAAPAPRRPARRVRRVRRRSASPSRRPNPSAPEPVPPPGVPGSRRCASSGRCARRAGPSGSRPHPEPARRTG